jgi:DNA-binding IclR family transcriptional regulator
MHSHTLHFSPIPCISEYSEILSGYSSTVRGAPREVKEFMSSPPTDRVIDIIELLAHQETTAPRTAEIARTLDISQSTAHAIVNALCDRAWLSRDPVDKTISLGPALESVAEMANIARPRAHAARRAALELSQSVGYAASVSERAEMSLVLTYFGGGGAPHAMPSGDRFPFAAPFGSAFAAWETEQGRRSWIERGAIANPEATGRLLEMLDETRARGFSVERMTPTLARTSELLRSLDNDPWSTSVRQVIDDALVEISTAGLRTDDGEEDRPITAISAPVVDRHGLAVLNLAVHPFMVLTSEETAAIGNQLLTATTTVDRATTK